MYYRITVKVFGDVQGVGFRYSTQDYAREIGLKGYAKNLSDGTVEVIAEGDKSKIDSLIGFLYDHPGMSTVDNLDVKQENIEHLTFNTFFIKF